MAIFGSSNWTSASAEGQHEHNLFTTRPWYYSQARAHFDRKWNNSAGHTETKPFVPLPPDAPSYFAPANGAAAESILVTRVAARQARTRTYPIAAAARAVARSAAVPGNGRRRRRLRRG